MMGGLKVLLWVGGGGGFIDFAYILRFLVVESLLRISSFASSIEYNEYPSAWCGCS
jgi:hypothetical protein